MTEALLVLSVFVPLVAGVLQFLFGTHARGLWATASVAATVLLCALLLAAFVTEGSLEHAMGGWAPPLGIRLYIDGLAALMLMLTTVVGALVSVYALHAHSPRHADGAAFWSLWLMLWGSLNALFLSADLFNIYVTLELVTLAAIPMVVLAGPDKTADAALRYLLFALFGSLVYLAGVAIVYGMAGSLDLSTVAGPLAESGVTGWIAAACLLTGILIKAAVVPFHVWLPAAHGNAPAAVSAVLSALVVKAAIYLVLRLWTEPLAGIPGPAVAQAMGVLGVSAIIYGSLQAFRQERLKLVVAYSTVAQLGYMLLFFPLAVTSAWHGAVYHGLAHGVAKAALFLAAGNVLLYVGHDRLRELRGLDRPLALSLMAFALAGVSIMGLPPSGGFIAKWLLLSASLETGQWWWAVALVLGGLLAAAYIFRVLRFAFLDTPGPAIDRSGPVPPPVLAWSAMALALIAIALGFTADPLLSLLGDIPGGQP